MSMAKGLTFSIRTLENIRFANTNTKVFLLKLKARLHRRFQPGVFAEQHDFRVKSLYVNRQSVYTYWK